MRHFLLAVLGAVPLVAADPLTITDAIHLALDKHPAIEAGAALTHAAGSRITQARAAYLPHVNYAESWTRSDNPVFVFSSLLGQHQFTEANFGIETLNRPDFLNNFQSQVTIEQTIYDWGASKAQVRSAELGRSISEAQERSTKMVLIARVVRAYNTAVLARASVGVAREAIGSAEADARRAESVRDAGMSTDADVLSIRVHLAAVREQAIRRDYEAQVAMASLNETLALPLDTDHALVTPLNPVQLPGRPAAQYQAAAGQNRPELKQSELAADAAEQQSKAARSALLPQVAIRGGFEADRQDFVQKGGANWLISASVRWNLFDGSANRARVSEAKALLESAHAQQKAAAQGVQLEVFKAWADARSAEERIGVATAAVAQAEESLRITKNRYESGLSTVADLLRNETAVLEARTRRLAAIHDQRVAAAQLELASGTLTADSEIVR